MEIGGYGFEKSKLLKITEDIYALKPLKRVDYYTLTHLSKHLNEYGYYAIKDGLVYVKHQPDTLSHLGLTQTLDSSGAPYFIRFRMVHSDFSDLLIPYGANKALQVRLMVVFKTNNSSVSPKLKNFQLIAH